MLRHINITDINSVANAREATRDIAESLHFPDRDLRPVLNIVSEIALACVDLGRTGKMSVSGIVRPDFRGICILNRFPVAPAAEDADDLGCPSLTLGGMKSLSNHFQISRTSGEVIINAVKWASS